MQNAIGIPDVRNKIISELSTILEDRFKVKNRKGENYFIKSYDKGYLKIQFFYENYFPLHSTVSLVMSIWQNDIQEIRKRFYLRNNFSFTETPNIIFFEGDFVPELKDLLLKYRHGHKNRISSADDLNQVLGWYKKLLPHLLEIHNQFVTLPRTAEYLESNKELLVKNCSRNAIETHLIVAKLLDLSTYSNTFIFYKQNLSYVIKDYGVMAKNAIDSIERLDVYLDEGKYL